MWLFRFRSALNSTACKGDGAQLFLLGRVRVDVYADSSDIAHEIFGRLFFSKYRKMGELHDVALHAEAEQAVSKGLSRLKGWCGSINLRSYIEVHLPEERHSETGGFILATVIVEGSEGDKTRLVVIPAEELKSVPPTPFIDLGDQVEIGLAWQAVSKLVKAF